MRIARHLHRLIDPALRRADLAVVRRSYAEKIHPYNATPVAVPPLPDGAEDVLRADHPRLAEYERRYRGHPAAGVSQWTSDYVRDTIGMRAFRAHNSYVWQKWDLADSYRYGLATYFARLHDRLGLFDRLDEDGLFGAETYEIDGTLVSRDLLDSITELTFLDEELGLGHRDVTVLDIGAGYGRLGHRATTAFDNVRYVCTDAIALSTFLSRYYLDFRGVTERATVVPLDQIAEAMADTRVDLAVNVHSFSEAPLSAIRWWLDLLAQNAVKNLFIVPNTGTRLLSTESDQTRVDFLPLLTERGYELRRIRPKYGDSKFMERHGLSGRFPHFYLLFELRHSDAGR